MYIWQGPNKTYTKWILIPLWISHLLFLLPAVGVFGYFMLDLAGLQTFQDKPIPPEFSAFLALLIIALLLEPLEMVFQSYRILEPWIYLVSQVYKALIGTVIVGISTYGFTRGGPTAVFVWALALLWMLGLSYYASLVYAAVVMHRHLQFSKYAYVKDPMTRDDEAF